MNSLSPLVLFEEVPLRLVPLVSEGMSGAAGDVVEEVDESEGVSIARLVLVVPELDRECVLVWMGGQCDVFRG